MDIERMLRRATLGSEPFMIFDTLDKIKLLDLFDEIDKLLANTKGMDELRQARQNLGGEQ